MAKRSRRASKGILDKAGTAVLAAVKSLGQGLAKEARHAVHQALQHVMDTLAAGAFLLLGLVFVAIALALLISDAFGLESHWGYLIIGLAVIIGSLLLKRRTDTRYLGD
jgi:hypothetical protein